MTAVKLVRQEETVVIGKPRYDSKSKGLVENVHPLVQGLLRTWVASIENRYKTALSASSRLVQWSVRHCCWSLTRYTILEADLTPYRKLRGREYGGAIAELGETVQFHVQCWNR